MWSKETNQVCGRENPGLTVAPGMIRMCKKETEPEKPLERWERLRQPDFSSFLVSRPFAQ
jgi:hypothetical protein